MRDTLLLFFSHKLAIVSIWKIKIILTSTCIWVITSFAIFADRKN